MWYNISGKAVNNKFPEPYFKRIISKGVILMQSITYSQVQDLISRLPATKLSKAYDLLLDLVKDEPNTVSSQVEFMSLPLNERQRLMAEEAQRMIEYYSQTKPEREEWQQGEFNEY
jgi:hypothetical protein